MDWLEAWVDSASRGEYVLLVRGFRDRVVVIDPQAGGEQVARFATYDETSAWLNEDEYDLIESRWVPEL
jgi:hypothetical protein